MKRIIVLLLASLFAAAITPSISYNAELANKGLSYFKEVGCTACHSIKSLGVSGGAVGPDLSKALFSNTQWLGRYYKENGLQNPAADPQKAAELLAQYLVQPPRYSTTMAGQVAAYKALYGEQWDKEYVPALVELMKMSTASTVALTITVTTTTTVTYTTTVTSTVYVPTTTTVTLPITITREVTSPLVVTSPTVVTVPTTLTYTVTQTMTERLVVKEADTALLAAVAVVALAVGILIGGVRRRSLDSTTRVWYK